MCYPTRCLGNGTSLRFLFSFKLRVVSPLRGFFTIVHKLYKRGSGPAYKRFMTTFGASLVGGALGGYATSGYRSSNTMFLLTLGSLLSTPIRPAHPLVADRRPFLSGPAPTSHSRIGRDVCRLSLGVQLGADTCVTKFVNHGILRRNYRAYISFCAAGAYASDRTFVELGSRNANLGEGLICPARFVIGIISSLGEGVFHDVPKLLGRSGMMSGLVTRGDTFYGTPKVSRGGEV